MQNSYENFLHENFYLRSNYSNRAVIYVNHTKIFLYKTFYHENFFYTKIKRITFTIGHLISTPAMGILLTGCMMTKVGIKCSLAGVATDVGSLQGLV